MELDFDLEQVYFEFVLEQVDMEFVLVQVYLMFVLEQEIYRGLVIRELGPHQVLVVTVLEYQIVEEAEPSLIHLERQWI